MSNQHRVLTALLVAVSLAATLAGRAPQAPATGEGKPDSAEVKQHLDAAKKIAGIEWADTASFFCASNPNRANRPDDPLLEPTKLFDNVYVIGRAGTAVFAITTSDGIVLIDSGYADQLELVLLPGLTKLGLDPGNVKYIILGHGHADHFGGAPYFQQKYGTRIVMAAADWDLVETPAPARGAAPVQAPKRDMVAADGQTLAVGDEKFTFVAIPGHTPGSIGIVFPVKDGRTTHRAALFGGTILIPGRISDDALRQYLRSIDHFVDVTRKNDVDVELQNHPLYDGIVDKINKLSGRKPGARHPFVVGKDSYQRFLRVMSECMRAQIARRSAA